MLFVRQLAAATRQKGICHCLSITELLAVSLAQVVVGKQQDETENAFVGGRNRWTYDSFVNWEFWWPGFPVLVYFKVVLLYFWAFGCSSILWGAQCARSE